MEAWIVEAEEILQGQDPSHSSDLSTIQERMEELKVSVFKSSSQIFYLQNPKENSKLLTYAYFLFPRKLLPALLSSSLERSDGTELKLISWSVLGDPQEQS